MPGVEELLRTVGAEAERQVRSQLSGFFGGFVREYLPQVWVFRTEEGSASLSVAADGKVAVTAGEAATPDVTIEIGYARLRAALTTRSRAAVPPGPLTVTPHSTKGRVAFDYLRGRLGL